MNEQNSMPLKNSQNDKSEDISIEYLFNLFAGFFFCSASLVLGVLFSTFSPNSEQDYVALAFLLFGLLGYYFIGEILVIKLLSRASKKVRIFYGEHKKAVEYGLPTAGFLIIGLILYLYIGKDIAMLIFGGLLGIGIPKFYSWLEKRNQ